MFAVVFGGCCAKLKNIWIAFGFDMQSLGELVRIFVAGCKGICKLLYSQLFV